MSIEETSCLYSFDQEILKCVVQKWLDLNGGDAMFEGDRLYLNNGHLMGLIFFCFFLVVFVGFFVQQDLSF